MRAVLTYHSIDRSGSPVSISPEVFREHVRWLTSGRVPVLPLDELASHPAGQSAVAITFDDALESAGSEALPRLIAAGLPVTVFVPTGHVGRDTQWASAAGRNPLPSLPVMSWARLEAFAALGVDIGAHTRTHPRLTECSDQELESELAGARDDIAATLGITPIAVAYPYGVHNVRAREKVAVHYRFGFTTELRPLSGSAAPESLPRLDAWYFRRPGRLATWRSRRLRARLELLRAVRALRGS